MIYDPCHDAGGMSAYEWERDPKRIGFILARYKFVAKMLQGKDSVLEVGCADAFGSRLVRQSVKELIAVDSDEKSIAQARKVNIGQDIQFMVMDVLKDVPDDWAFDAVYCLDVLEHIHPLEERGFLRALRACAPVAIIGCPSLEAQPYASELSRQGHINCKTGPDFRRALQDHWSQVFLFGMNDETLHTGFEPMQHYRLALCC